MNQRQRSKSKNNKKKGKKHAKRGLEQNWVNDKWEKAKVNKKGKNNFKRRKQY